MKSSIILSDRQKPRTLQLLKDLYTAHLADARCELKGNCPQLKATKAKIEELEREVPSNASNWRSGA